MFHLITLILITPQSQLTEKLEEENKTSTRSAEANQIREKVADNKRDILRRLQSLGVEATEEQLYEKTVDSAAEFQAAQKEVQSKDDLQAYETYERVWNTVLGLECVEFISGSTRFNATFHGADFMDMLPAPISIIASRRRMERQGLASS